jgi:hypothetical protein
VLSGDMSKNLCSKVSLFQLIIIGGSLFNPNTRTLCTAFLRLLCWIWLLYVRRPH